MAQLSPEQLEEMSARRRAARESMPPSSSRHCDARGQYNFRIILNPGRDAADGRVSSPCGPDGRFGARRRAERERMSADRPLVAGSPVQRVGRTSGRGRLAGRGAGRDRGDRHGDGRDGALPGQVRRGGRPAAQSAGRRSRSPTTLSSGPARWTRRRCWPAAARLQTQGQWEAAPAEVAAYLATMLAGLRIRYCRCTDDAGSAGAAADRAQPVSVVRARRTSRAGTSAAAGRRRRRRRPPAPAVRPIRPSPTCRSSGSWPR